jgi:hypothetical protein
MKRPLEQRLLSLKQTGTTREYANKFRTVSCGLGWNAASLQDTFYRGLSDRIKDIICIEERSNTVEEYIYRAEIIDDRIQLREQKKRMDSWRRAS